MSRCPGSRPGESSGAGAGDGRSARRARPGNRTGGGDGRHRQRRERGGQPARRCRRRCPCCRPVAGPGRPEARRGGQGPLRLAGPGDLGGHVPRRSRRPRGAPNAAEPPPDADGPCPRGGATGRGRAELFLQLLDLLNTVTKLAGSHLADGVDQVRAPDLRPRHTCAHEPPSSRPSSTATSGRRARPGQSPPGSSRTRRPPGARRPSRSSPARAPGARGREGDTWLRADPTLRGCPGQAFVPSGRDLRP